MMLDFWGMIILNVTSGVIKRSDNYKDRYKKWMGTHNNLRISRCLKSLGELGLNRFQLPLVEFLIEEVMSGEIKGSFDSLVNYWIPMLSEDDQKKVKKKFVSGKD
jgi:hypothetical protein